MTVNGIENIEFLIEKSDDIKDNKKKECIDETKSITESFQRDLKNVVKNEKDVENRYKIIFHDICPKIKISSPFNTDGVVEFENFSILLEIKDKANFNDEIVRCNVLTQAIWYLQKFYKNDPTHIPNVIFIGDREKCFWVRTKDIQNFANENWEWYKDKSIDWLSPASEAAKNYSYIPKRLQEIGIMQKVLTINVTSGEFRFGDIIKILKNIEVDSSVGIKLSRDNIRSAFAFFMNDVVINKNKITSDIVVDGREMFARWVDIFFDCLTNDSTRTHYDNDKKILIYEKMKVNINSRQYEAFFNLISKNYTLTELRDLVKIKDVLIEEMMRRKTGAYFTPDLWINKAYEMMDEQFGDDWKQEYVVWDCASGTNNLTRNETFKNLYSSTLMQGDVDTVNDMRYIGKTFKFDFLNDDFSSSHEENLNTLFKKSDGLKTYFESYKNRFIKGSLRELKISSLEKIRPILFLINPPYTTGVHNSNVENHNKQRTGVVKTRMNKFMLEDGYGQSAQQLYAQFLYRIMEIKKYYKLVDVKICLFSPPLFLTGKSFESFRREFYKDFKFKSGMLFPANEFADVSDSWGISFTIWESKGLEEVDMELDIYLDVCKMENNNIKVIGKKKFGPVSYRASKWVKEDIKGKKVIDLPQTRNGINIKQDGTTMRGHMIQGAMGYFHIGGNDVYHISSSTALFTTPYSIGNGNSITIDNFMKCCALFTARKTIKSNWINQKDEYSVPDISKIGYDQWNNDSIIYSLFNSSSNQSSLRNVEYKGNIYQIKNHFFFMSNKEILDISDKIGFKEMFNDAYYDKEDRYVYNLLQDISLSQDALDVLNEAKRLWLLSMSKREEYHNNHPECNLQCWDAGWVQVKNLLKKYYPDELRKFRELYLKFEVRMRNGVYEFGFLPPELIPIKEKKDIAKMIVDREVEI